MSDCWRLKIALCASSFLMGLAPSVAQAQDSGASERSGLEEIIVTARKRSESVQDIPVAVKALSDTEIRQQDIASLEKLSGKVPDLVITRSASGSGASLSIRGIGSNFSSVGIEQSVAVIVDGAYYGHGRVLEEGLFDLSRLEVLKGPQALFFGKNATAGVISVTTADPGSSPEFRGRIGYEFKAQQAYAEAIGSTPLSDTLGLRIALRGTKMWGGYTRNRAVDAAYSVFDAATFLPGSFPAQAAAREQPGTKDIMGRMTLKWEPSDEFTNTLKISGTSSRSGSPGYNAIVRCFGETMQRNPSIACGDKFTIYQNNAPQAFIDAGTRGYKRAELYSDYDSYSINNVANYTLDQVALTAVVNYNHNKSSTLADYGAASDAAVWTAIPSKFGAFSAEARALTTFASPINALVGFYYQSSKRQHEEDVSFFGAYDSSAEPQNRFLAFNKESVTRGKTYAVYGQLIAKLAPQVEITGGARYTHETKRSTFIQPYVNSLFTGTFLPETPIDRRQTFDNLSPDATVTWRPSSHVTAFIAYKTGYKSGGFSNSSLQTPTDPTGNSMVFGPEKARGFEGGIKTTLFDRQLRFNVVGYYYKYRGLQVDYFDAQNVIYVTRNAGSARNQGFEVELEYAPRGVPGLVLSATGAYNDAQYLNFLGPCYSGQSQADGCNVLAAGAAPGSTPTLQQLGGATTANAPKWVATLGIDYTTAISDALELGFSTDFRYSSRYNGSPFNADYTWQGKYATLDASIRLGAADGAWQVALIGKNLTNRQYMTGAFDITGTGNGTGTPAGGLGADIFGYSALPRTVQAEVSFAF